MSLIPLAPGVPGIRAALTAYPETAGPILAVAQAALRTPSPLTEGERELIATAVSVRNGCRFCARSHGETARILLGDQGSWVDDVLAGREPSGAGAKLKSLVALAQALASSVHGIGEAQKEACRAAGATDRELHDTVLVAAAFSLFNRYVDGLGAPEPADEADYLAMGRRLASSGYR